MMAYKRKTKKIGSTTKRTTTQSSKGTRITHSTKSSLGGTNKRTYSWSWSKDGRLKQTFTDNRNGWISRKSRTLGKKPKTYRAPKWRSAKSSGLGMGAIVVFLIIGAILLGATSFPLLAVVAGILLAAWLIWILLPFLVWGGVIVFLIWLFLL